MAVLCERAGRGGEKERDDDRTHNIHPRAGLTFTAAYLLESLNRLSTLPRHFLLHPHEGSSISHPLGLDGYIGFFARRLYGFDGLCDAQCCPFDVPGEFPCGILLGIADGRYALPDIVSHDLAQWWPGGRPGNARFNCGRTGRRPQKHRQASFRHMWRIGNLVGATGRILAASSKDVRTELALPAI
jgi:hypothetical protein